MQLFHSNFNYPSEKLAEQDLDSVSILKRGRKDLISSSLPNSEAMSIVQVGIAYYFYNQSSQQPVATRESNTAWVIVCQSSQSEFKLDSHMILLSLLVLHLIITVFRIYTIWRKNPNKMQEAECTLIDHGALEISMICYWC